jgi:hypothetical protein
VEPYLPLAACVLPQYVSCHHLQIVQLKCDLKYTHQVHIAIIIFPSSHVSEISMPASTQRYGCNLQYTAVYSTRQGRVGSPDMLVYPYGLVHKRCSKNTKRGLKVLKTQKCIYCLCC